MTKHTGMPAQINGKKGKPHLHGLWKTKMPPVKQKSLKRPSLEAVRLCWGEQCFPSGYAFSFTPGFTHSERQCLWRGGFSVGFGEEPFSFFCWKCWYVSHSLHQKSALAQETVRRWLPHRDSRYNKTFSRACFLIKIHSQGPLLPKRSKKQLSWYKGSWRHTCQNE